MSLSTSLAGPPESVVRNRTPIPSRPDTQKWLADLGDNVARLGNGDTREALQNIVDELSRLMEVTWDAIEILDKRYDGAAAAADVEDSEYTEIGRDTERQTRVIQSDSDPDIQVTVEDVISPKIVLRGNRTGRQIKLLFNAAFL